MQGHASQLVAATPETVTPALGRWTRFRQSPLLLQSFVAFAIFAAAVTFVGIAVRPLGALIVPFIGWSGGINYLNTLFFAISAAITRQRRLVWGAVAMLAVFVAIDGVQTVRHLVSYNESAQASGNPYLVVHDLRPVFTLVLPATWILLLSSPGMWRWMNGAPCGERDRRRQMSIADLMYLVAVVAVSLAVSLALFGVMKRTRELHLVKQQIQQRTPPATWPLKKGNQV
jgi:hypothetical protein